MTPLLLCLQGRFSADGNFLILDRARYKADPQERGCACGAAQLSMFSIRLSPPLCPARRNIRVVTVVDTMTPNLRDMKSQGV